jgi:HlyD family secretion protein
MNGWLTPACAGLAALVLLGCNGRGGTDAIEVSGNIETIETQVSFKIPGRMLERTVDEGDDVKAGQVVARLDSEDLKQRVAANQAAVDAAQAVLRELESGYRKEDVAQAKARLDAASAEVKRLAADDARQEELFKREVISAREYDASHTAFLAAQAGERQAAEQYALLKRGYRSEQIDQARAQLEQAKQALALARTQLGYAELFSPVSGVVLSKNAEPGEVLAAGAPVVTVGDVSHVYLRAYVEETDLGKVKLGQKVKVTCDSYPSKAFEGRVSFISPEAEFTPRSVQTQKERVKLVYRIKVDVANPAQELKPGMPADGVIEVGN